MDPKVIQSLREIVRRQHWAWLDNQTGETVPEVLVAQAQHYIEKKDGELVEAPPTKKKARDRRDEDDDGGHILVVEAESRKLNPVMVDLYSASAAVQIYDKLSTGNQAIYEERMMPLERLMDLTWKIWSRTAMTPGQ